MSVSSSNLISKKNLFKSMQTNSSKKSKGIKVEENSTVKNGTPVPNNQKDHKIKKLTELIPHIDQSNSLAGESSKVIDFYFENKSLLTYYEVNSNILPWNMKDSYSNFNCCIENLRFMKTTHFNEDNKVQLNSYENNNSQKFIMKKSWLKYDHSKSNPITLGEMEHFIKTKYNEFNVMKIVNGSVHSVTPFLFNIIHLPMINYIVTELLMSNGGSPLTQFLQKMTPNEMFDVIVQITKGLHYFEVYKIENPDLKVSNILLDSDIVKGNPIIRFTNLIQGKKFSFNPLSSRDSANKGIGSTYCSPELIQIYNDSKELKDSFNIWKSQIYSLGILILFLVGYFPDQMSCVNFDTYKGCEVKYEMFLKEFQNYSLNISDSLLRNIIKIAEICISYNPDKRLSAYELLEILPLILNKSLQEVEKACQEIISHRNKENDLDNLSNYTRSNSKDCKGHLRDENDEINKLNPSSSFSMKPYLNSALSKAESKAIINENYELKNEINTLREGLKTKTDILALLQEKLNNKEKEIEKERVETSKKKEEYKNNHQEKDINIEKLKEEINLLKTKNQKLENEGSEYINKLKQVDLKLQEANKKVNDLESSEKSYKENIEKFNLIKNKIEKEKLIEVGQCVNFFQLSTKLYEYIISQKAVSPNFNIHYGEHLLFEKGVFYTGPIIKRNIPHGIGILYYDDLKIKFIGEFEHGKIKSNLGMFSNEKGDYFFGHISNGNSLCPILKYANFPEHKGKQFYIGEIKNFIEEGNGKYVSVDGTTYEGKFKKGLKDGVGKFVKANSYYYEGEWNSNIQEGKGHYAQEDGYHYEGEFRKGKFDGKGKETWKDGEYHEGDYKNGQYEGRAKHVLPDGNYYEGDYKNNMKEGKGKAVFLDGECYDGEWKEGKKHGAGKLTLTNGECYCGEWKNNVKEGVGKLVLANGEYYFGQFKDNKFEGKGKYGFPDGEYYEGDYKNNQREGKGKIVMSKGGYFEGEMKNDKMNGKGKEVMANGDYFVGEFKHQIKEGYGKYVYMNGEFYEGELKEGRIEGKGKKVWANGNIYEGEWKNNKSNGLGKFSFAQNGKVTEIREGKWVDGLIEGKVKCTLPNETPFYMEFKNGIPLNLNSKDK